MNVCPDCGGEGELLCGLYPPPECAACDGTGERFGPLKTSMEGMLDDEPITVRVGLLRELLTVMETA